MACVNSCSNCNGGTYQVYTRDPDTGESAMRSYQCHTCNGQQCAKCANGSTCEG